jgi:hypothetical protein
LVEGSVVGVGETGVVIGASGVVGGAGVGTGVANRTFFFGGGVAVACTLRIGCTIGCVAGAGMGVSNTLRGGLLGGGDGDTMGMVGAWVVSVQMPVIQR